MSEEHARLSAAMRERFHKVILSAGYSEEAAQSILDKYHDEYMKDFPAFIKMLESYEANDGDPE